MQQPDKLYSSIKKAIKNKRMPMAILHKESFEKNIDYFIEKSGTKKVRVATKSIRCRTILNQIKKSLSDKFAGYMCYSAEEALWLSSLGEDDLLVAYPCWNKNQIKALSDEIKQGRKIYLMVDSIAHIEHIQSLAEKENIVIPLCIDIDVSLKLPFLNFGVFRSPINNTNKFHDLVKVIKESSHTSLRGIMAYEAQIAGVPDRQYNKPILNLIITALKKLSLNMIEERRKKCVEICQSEGFELDFINGGGTGSLDSTCLEKHVSEVTIGSGFYTPTLFDQYQSLNSLPSLFYAIEITRRPEANIYTCLGGGYVASGALGIEKLPKPFLPQGAKLISTEMAGEVQTPIQFDPFPLELGDPILMRHAKAGELCEHFENIVEFSEEEGLGEVFPTYRGEGKAFL